MYTFIKSKPVNRYLICKNSKKPVSPIKRLFESPSLTKSGEMGNLGRIFVEGGKRRKTIKNAGRKTITRKINEDFFLSSRGSGVLMHAL